MNILITNRVKRLWMTLLWMTLMVALAGCSDSANGNVEESQAGNTFYSIEAVMAVYDRDPEQAFQLIRFGGCRGWFR